MKNKEKFTFFQIKQKVTVRNKCGLLQNILTRRSQRYYIQSAFAIPDEKKRVQETVSLTRTGDSFRKIVVVRENITPWHDENGILYVGIEDFLLDESAMNL